jgi:MFS family permease
VRKQAWTLIAFGSVSMLLTGMIGPIMPLYLKSIHFPVEQIGIIIAVGGFTSAIFALFFGNLSERFNRTRLFLVSAAVFALLPLAYAVSRDSGQFIGIELLAGVVGSLVGVTSKAILMDVAKASGSPGKLMGTARSWRSAMYVVGPLIGGAAVTWLSFRGLFYAESALLITLVAVAAVLLGGQPAPERRDTSLFSMPKLLMKPAVLALLAILLLDFLNFQVIIFIFPLYASAAGLPTVLIGVLVTTQALAYAIVQKPVGRLSDKGASVPLLALCVVLGGPLIFSLSLVRSPIALAGIMLLIGLASAPIFLLVTLLVSDAAGDQTGVAMGMINFIVYLAVGLAPLLTALLSAIKLRYGFLVPLGSSALAIPLVFVTLRHTRLRKPDEVQPATADAGAVS